MDTYAYCIYDEIGALTNGGQEPFYREGDVHSVYCGIGRATAYRRFVSLVESGWLVDLDAGERNRRPNGHYFPTRFRFVKHSEWVKSHPEGCDKRIMEVWNAKLHKGAPDNTSVENVVADYTTKKARTKWAKELSPTETASYPTETAKEGPVSAGDSQLSTGDSQLSTGDESVSAGSRITRVPVLVTCKNNPYPLTPVSTGDNLKNDDSKTGELTSKVSQCESAPAPIQTRASGPGRDMVQNVQKYARPRSRNCSRKDRRRFTGSQTVQSRAGQSSDVADCDSGAERERGNDR
jgi:hypothetical protein